MPWLALLKPLAALLEKLLTLFVLWRAHSAGRRQAELARERKTNARARAASAARARQRRAADAGGLRDDDGYRRE